MFDLSIAGPSDYWLLENGEITEGEITPEDFGIARASLDLCKSGSPEENAEELKRIFSGKKGPVTDFVCMNAAAALKISGKAKSFREAMKLARSVIQSGAAMQTLNKFIAYIIYIVFFSQ